MLGDTEAIRALVSAGADVNARDRRDLTPLDLAALWGNTETTQALAVVGDANVRNGWGLTPLLWAAYEGHVETAMVLVSAGADVNARDGLLGRTALHMAAVQGDTETGRALIAAGADVDVTDEEGLAPWELAYAMGYRETARVVSVVPRGCFSLPGDGEETVRMPSSLHEAAKQGDTESVRVFIAAGADVNARSDDGLTPLHYANLPDSRGDTKAVRVLIAAGADVNARNDIGATPLLFATLNATRNGDTEIVMVLVSAGADVNAAIEDGTTPLHVAAIVGHTDIARALVSIGADVNAVDEDGLTPARLAEREGYAETAAVLIKASAEVTEGINYEEWRSKLMDKLESTGAGQSAWERYPVGGERYGMNYWVYEDRVTNHARVHEETCGHCNYGEGRGHGRNERENEWYGPFWSREEAFRRAGATGRRDVSGCGHCRP